MPKDITSPFTPGVPVPAEFFVGRLAEIKYLKKEVARAESGRLEVGFLIGERGIGKSSLASFVRSLSERDRRMIGLHAFLGGVTSLEEMVRRIYDRLLKESLSTPWHEKVKKFFGNHIREVGLFGVSLEFGAPFQDLKRLVHDFAPALRNLLEQVKDEKSGLFIVLDDINGLASSLEFTNWLKSLVDEIATSREPLPLCLLMVGTEERRQAMIDLQPSLARYFDLVEIRAWGPQETRDFFKKGFSSVGMTIDDGATDFLSRFAGGLPMLAQEIGDAAFVVDTDGQVNQADAVRAVMAAADVVGRKHLQPQVFHAIRSRQYRMIIRKVAREPFEAVFKRKEVLSRLTETEKKVFDNFLQRMRRLGVICPDPEQGMGVYRFSHLLHYFYFWMEAERAKEKSEP